MKAKKFILCFLCVWSVSLPQAWSQRDSISFAPKPTSGLLWQKPLPITLTGLTIAAGTTPLFLEPMQRQNILIREEVQMWRRNAFDHRAMYFDNIFQYAPYSAVVLLNLAGVPSRDERWSLLRRTASTIILTTVVTHSIKHLNLEMRPDRSSSTSFPSGHTAFAFSGAELLRLEYGKTSVWIPIAGYAVALLTGFMRIYNDRHWAGDVFAGAGIGMLSADLSFWLNDLWEKKQWKK